MDTSVDPATLTMMMEKFDQALESLSTISNNVSKILDFLLKLPELHSVLLMKERLKIIPHRTLPNNFVRVLKNLSTKLVRQKSIRRRQR